MCNYCDRPYYEITLPCIGAEIINYPKDNKDNKWVEIEMSYQCPECGTIWTNTDWYHAN